MSTEKLPIAIVIPHAGLAIPPELNGRLAISDTHMINECDWYAMQLFEFRDRVLYWEMFPFARALIDVNRPADAALHHRPGDAAVKRQTSYGDPVFLPDQEPDAALEAQLIRQYWQPWHLQLEKIARDPAVKLVFDCHTMAAWGPDLYDDPARPRPRTMVANLGDAQAEQRPDEPMVSAPPALARAFAAQLAFQFADVTPLVETGPVTAVNDPFFGGWDLRAHAGPRQPWLMVELSRALTVGAQTGETPLVIPDAALVADLRDRMWAAIEATTRWYLEEKNA